MRGEDTLELSSDRIDFLSFPNILRSVDLDSADSPDVPADAEIDLLTFPVFNEDDAP